MPSVPNVKTPGPGIKQVYIGMLFDNYTPAVEAQIMRDCFQMQQVASRDEEVVVVCDSDKPDRVLQSIGIRRIPTAQLAKMWILYKTQEQWPVEPEWATTVVQRDLWVKPKDPLILREVDGDEANGYYLPPQGRLSPDTISLERPAPNGYIPLDYAAIMVWSSAEEPADEGEE